MSSRSGKQVLFNMNIEYDGTGCTVTRCVMDKSTKLLDPPKPGHHTVPFQCFIEARPLRQLCQVGPPLKGINFPATIPHSKALPTT